LCLDEAEPDCWFFLIVGAQFNLEKCECCGKFLTDLLSYGELELVDGCCPGGGEWAVLRRCEELVRHCKIVLNKARIKKILQVVDAVLDLPRSGEDRNAGKIGLKMQA
jgi:hypothetical protein